jgi:hypothetical protein
MRLESVFITVQLRFLVVKLLPVTIVALETSLTSVLEEILHCMKSNASFSPVSVSVSTICTE